MTSINMRSCTILALFCSLALLAMPATAETLQTIEQDVTEPELPESELPEPEVTQPEAAEPKAVNASEVQKSVSRSPEKQQESQRAYERKSIYARHVNLPTLALETDYLHDSWFVPKNGDGYPLTNEEFYEALGNPALLEQYTANRSQKNLAGVLLIGGTIGAVGFATWTYLAFITDVFSSMLGPMNPYGRSNGAYIVPLSGLAISTAAIITGAVITPKIIHPLKTNDAAKILDEYNNNLKQALGLPQDYPPMPANP